MCEGFLWREVLPTCLPAQIQTPDPVPGTIDLFFTASAQTEADGPQNGTGDDGRAKEPSADGARLDVEARFELEMEEVGMGRGDGAAVVMGERGVVLGGSERLNWAFELEAEEEDVDVEGGGERARRFWGYGSYLSSTG
ncbi:hypothetical protein AG1IA_09656 [Rhizoctonia solani AG-1 IA]|uniref:Uncharacterized protein n=1 Tax=Thanatephorus cucumeris (strain AG1-IA) TaxID=983506 RepID=L8WEG0_THACA|nr:hypothetical protein AG1IA_09656 [Rhizoctonia solani AG-1 IA]